MGSFKPGDRVSRNIDIYNPEKSDKHGVVTRKYNEPEKTVGEITLGPYPILYEVKWDNGRIERGFLPHGIWPETNSIERD